MATGAIVLPPSAAILPDGAASNLPPAVQRIKGSGTPPVYYYQLAFDASQEEWAVWQFRMPADYASAPVAKIQYKMTSATSGNVVWTVRIAAITPGDAVSVSAKTFATADSVTDAVPGTVGYLDEASLTMTNTDSVAAGDLVLVRLARDGANASDTATGDAECVGITLQYTTT
jgi:hypothetical protein